MCIAILTTGNARVPTENLEKGWRSNPDGGGLAFIRDGKVEIKKGLMSLPDFMRNYDEAHESSDAGSSMLIHFRVGTSGIKRSPNNTHPFEIKPQKGPKGAMIHNGIMFTPAGGWTGPENDLFSDTRVFASANNNILTLENVARNHKEIKIAIGGHNKLVFLYDNNEHVIVNEEAGYWHEGMWFSNLTCGLGGSTNVRR